MRRWLSLSFLRRATPGNVLSLAAVSFLNDLSSEMLYPLLPAFFAGLADPASAALYVGLMDGVAESVASFLKYYSGRVSDVLGVRKPLALLGYAVSIITRPGMAAAGSPWHVIALRLVDRVGKGVRTSPRDALLSESIPADVRGAAFGVHRMADHAGAMIGPLASLTFLAVFLGAEGLWILKGGATSARQMLALRYLFLLCFLPGVAALMVLAFSVREIPPGASQAASGGSAEQTRKAPLPRRFYFFLAALGVFALGNSSDLFLVFYAQTAFSLGLGYVPLLWLTLHVAKIIWSVPGGRFSDLAGRRVAIVVGWALYTAVYLLIPRVPNLWYMWLLLFLYGMYYGMTEGAERALVADVVPPESRGRAYGLYHAVTGFAALPASFLFGVFWKALGAERAFLIGACLAGAATLMLLGLVTFGRKER